MSSKKLKIILFLPVVIAGVALFYLFRLQRVEELPERLSIQEQKEMALDLEKRGVAGLRKKQAAPLIAVYERMLEKYPESADLKKKLAEAYRAAGETEKAEALQREIRDGKKQGRSD